MAPTALTETRSLPGVIGQPPAPWRRSSTVCSLGTGPGRSGSPLTRIGAPRYIDVLHASSQRPKRSPAGLLQQHEANSLSLSVYLNCGSLRLKRSPQGSADYRWPMARRRRSGLAPGSSRPWQSPEVLPHTICGLQPGVLHWSFFRRVISPTAITGSLVCHHNGLQPGATRLSDWSFPADRLA